MPHLPIELLVDHVRGVASDAERAVVTQHLAECAQCASLGAQLTELAATARADISLAVPDTVMDGAIAMFANANRARQHHGSDIARLVFDSARLMTSSGDSGSHEVPRQLFYEATDARFQLETSRSGGRVSLAGLVTTRSIEHASLATVLAMREWDGPEVARAACNDEGEFTLDYKTPVAVILHVSSLTWRHPIAVPVDMEIAGVDADTQEPRTQFRS